MTTPQVGVQNEHDGTLYKYKPIVTIGSVLGNRTATQTANDR
jgi:hypothetical protein